MGKVKSKKNISSDDYKINIKKSLEIETSNVLSIDPASLTGWAFSLEKRGSWDLSKMKSENGHQGKKWSMFLKRLYMSHKAHNFTEIIYERPVFQNAGATIHHSKLVAIIELFSEDFGVNCTPYSPTEIKKFATGSGVAKKSEMVSSCKENLKIDEDDDNIVDALWMLKFHHFKTNFQR